MKRKRPIAAAALSALALLLLAATCAFAGANVFDLPGCHIRHLQLLALMDASHEQKDYATMEEACREGLRLGAADELWSYNLACALARMKKKDEAFAWLDRAIDAGYASWRHMEEDEDLYNLRRDPRFGKAVEKARRAARDGEEGD